MKTRKMKTLLLIGIILLLVLSPGPISAVVSQTQTAVPVMAIQTMDYEQAWGHVNSLQVFRCSDCHPIVG